MARKIKKTTKKLSSQEVTRKPESEKIKKTKIRIIGIGGGGGSIVSELSLRVKKASFIVANTDSQALKKVSRKVLRFQFGESLTRGLGTGMNPEIGEQAAQNEKDKIKKILEGQDLCIIVASLGGGAGSGAAPVFAKISKKLGNITYGIFTLPFKFEGEKKVEIAKAALEKLRPNLNALSIIPNERIFQVIDRATPLKKALSLINKILSESLEGLIETIYEPGLINIDFADFRTISEGRGRLCYLNTVEVQRNGESIKDLIQKVLNSPLYPYSIRGAKGVLFNIAGEKALSLTEVSQISKAISELVNQEAKIIFGISQNKKYGNNIKTTLLAIGCGGPLKIFSKKPRKKRLKKKPTPKIIQPPPVIKLSPQIKKKSKKTKRKPKIKKTPKKMVKKIKIEVKDKSKEEETSQLETEPPKEISTSNSIGARVRKNALQIKKEAEDLEKEMIEKEKFWESPAFLRRQNKET